MKILILAHGEAPTSALFEESYNASQLCIACDGAALTAQAYGFTPDVIIGDLDSLDTKLVNPALIKHVADQNSNDLEKALLYAHELKAREVIILGATGLRFDHFLANLFILPKFADFFSIKLIDNYGYAFIAPQQARISAAVKTPISLFALGDKPVTRLCLSGLEYSLTNATLTPYSSRASLNYFSQEQAYITHESGLLLVHVAWNARQ